MNRLKDTLKKISTGIIVFVQVTAFSLVQVPRAAYAQEATETCPTASGTQAPTGADAHTYTFTPAPACVWENAYYTWDPVTKVKTPKFDTRACNPATGVCESVTWIFNPTNGQYYESRTVVYVPPAPSSQQQSPQAQTQAASTASADPNSGVSAAQSGSSTINSGNGTGSNNTVTTNGTTNANGTLNNSVNVLSTLDSNATSGNANALFNTTVGDVSTGDATTVANILNMIQSSWDPTQGDINVFTADLFANYYGDLLFDPSIMLGNGTDSNNTVTNNADQNLTLNVSNDANIQNDINLNAASGNATANGNTTVGDVSTGDANAVANVINMINSMITAGNSFIGSINLHGDLNGDILLPLSIMEILLGNGTGSNNTIANNNTTNADIDTSTSSSITNNTDLQADTGDAQANNNTTVGDVSTGNAETNVNEMNLVGQTIQNRGGLLVFVNVLGSWMGMLFNGPGTTSIAAGNGTNSNNTIANNTDTDVDLTVDNNYGITNNLNLTANSGDATANANTDVGNVSSGNATASANILNMIDSTMNFTDWFGVLFINVFGDWQGSFGTDTANGERPVATGGMGGGEGAPAANTSTSNASSGGSGSGGGSNGFRRTLAAFTSAVSAQAESEQSSETDVAATTSTPDTTAPTAGPTAPEANSSDESNTEVPTATVNSSRNNGAVWWITGIAGLTSLLLLGGERLLLLFRKP